MKQTKAQDEARHHARTHPMWAIERAAMQLGRPDLADLPDYSEPAKQKPGRPYWFRRIVWDCEAAARRRADIAACPYDYYDDGPRYDAAYLESYAEWFSKLLAEALATRESVLRP